MPSKSPKQKRFMAAAANNPEFARKAGISQSVAKEFHAADRRGRGGSRKATGGALRALGGDVGDGTRYPTPSRPSNGPLARNPDGSRGSGGGVPARLGLSRGRSRAVGGGTPPRVGDRASTDLGEVFGKLDGLRRRYAEGGKVSATLVTGTNCANCLYAEQPMEKAKPEDLNPQGGIEIEGEAELKRAQKADLITMPGSGRPETKFHCSHKDVNQTVNERMCCVYWDAPGTYRPWEDD